MSFDVNVLIRSLAALREGALVTIALAAAALSMSLVGGFALALLRLGGSRVLSGLAAGYVEVVRNIPLLIQIYVLYYALALYGLPLSGFATALSALVIQQSGYMAEIYRAAIQSVDPRTVEAGRALGMRGPTVFATVVAPIALTRSVPLLGNHAAMIVKDTSIASVIAVGEATHAAALLADMSAATCETFAGLALLYLALVSLVSLGARVLERVLPATA